MLFRSKKEISEEGQRVYLTIDAVAQSRGGGLAGVGVGDFAAHAGAGGHDGDMLSS